MKNKIIPLLSSVSLLIGVSSVYASVKFDNASFGPSGLPVTSVVAGDLNNDGANDALVFGIGRHVGGQNMICKKVEGSSTFECSTRFGYTNSPTTGVALGDFDSDDVIDIAVANGDCHVGKPQCQNYSALVVYFGKDNYTKATPISPSDLYGARSILVADVNDDDLKDILIGFAGGQPNIAYLSDGAGNFKATEFANLSSATLGLQVYAPGGTALYPFIISSARLPWRSMDNEFNGVFRYDESTDALSQVGKSFGADYQSVGLAIAPLTTDKSQYYIVTGNGGEPNKPGQQNNIWSIDSEGTVSSAPVGDLGAPDSRSRPVAIADINQDGLNDIAVGNLNISGYGEPQYSYAYINNSTGDILTFTPVELPNSSTADLRALIIAEFDDGLYLIGGNYCYGIGNCYSQYYKVVIQSDEK